VNGGERAAGQAYRLPESANDEHRGQQQPPKLSYRKPGLLNPTRQVPQLVSIFGKSINLTSVGLVLYGYHQGLFLCFWTQGIPHSTVGVIRFEKAAIS
jgi:hypothetical protein